MVPKSLSRKLSSASLFRGHIDWKYAGPSLEYEPLPAIIYLSLTAEQYLELNPLNQIVHFLSPSAQSSFREFSVTLPFHTSDMMENEAALEKWADPYKAGGDLVSGFVRRVNAALDKFIDFWFTNSERIYVAGLSRVGLLAAHVAAANKNVQACLGFAPVTVLHYLEEFADLTYSPNGLSRRFITRPYFTTALHSGGYKERVRISSPFGGAFSAERDTVSTPRVHYVLQSNATVFSFARSVGKQGHGTPPLTLLTGIIVSSRTGFLDVDRDVFHAGAEYMLSQLDASPQILSE
ncbi:hypothetical protein FGB62_124g032 [Gracilaria domingensis]|nr:hypothetical protein FGB62_124g032 [Gracilaria domingensis]